MVIRRNRPFANGYTPITEIGGTHADMLLDFGILVLEPGEIFASDEPHRERAYLLLEGEAAFCAGGRSVEAGRRSVLDDRPRTILDAATHAKSAMVLGEVVELPTSLP